MRAAGIGPGSRVAVAGLGGLGHLAVKFATALGAEATVLSRTPDKADDARKLGATDLLLTPDDKQLAQARGRFTARTPRRMKGGQHETDRGQAHPVGTNRHRALLARYGP
jgi:D-arabinose 1-dehydrogenase-like Zn-dependent alcohol dehydrogenase